MDFIWWWYSYKHALDGVLQVYRNEGLKRLFAGASTASTRAVFVTIGQIACYDQAKMILLATGIFKDNILTHFLSSLTAVILHTKFYCMTSYHYIICVRWFLFWRNSRVQLPLSLRNLWTSLRQGRWMLSPANLRYCNRRSCKCVSTWSMI